jgi:hypothetical protein
VNIERGRGGKQVTVSAAASIKDSTGVLILKTFDEEEKTGGDYGLHADSVQEINRVRGKSEGWSCSVSQLNPIV